MKFVQTLKIRPKQTSALDSQLEKQRQMEICNFCLWKLRGCKVKQNHEELANASATVVGQMKLWLLSLLCHEEISYLWTSQASGWNLRLYENVLKNNRWNESKFGPNNPWVVPF